jgi:hypothetical protein
MKRPRMHLKFLPLLAICLCAATFSGAAPAVAAARPGSVPDDAEALRLAEKKLAALAQEAKTASAPQAEAPKKVAEKKHPARKKRARRARHSVAAAAMSGTPSQKVLGRRLTPGEVQGILATTRDFSGTDLSGMNLVGQDFSGVKFNRANLQLANLERADLTESDLELADLTGANLRGASLNQARLRGTRMDGVRLDGALWIDKTVCKKDSVASCIE